MRRPEFFICCALLILIIVGIKQGLSFALEAWGFWAYMAICGVGTALVIAGAFAYDHWSARSPRSPPRELNDRPPSMR